jgi:hypothetical protein
MGIDTTFQPKTETFVVDSSAAVTIDGRQRGVTSWRIDAVGAAANQIVKWGPPAPAAAPVIVAPAIGAIMPNQINVNPTATVYLEGIGAFLQFIGSVAFATGHLEITGGQGGVGG